MVNLKLRIDIVKKYLNKVKIVEPCDSILRISEIPILTVGLFWSAIQGEDSGNF